jgi:hypothetical protein
MVFFVISRRGFEDFQTLSASNTSLWVTAEVVNQNEFDALRAAGISVTSFNYSLTTDDLAGIEQAIETVREHHPNQTVWVSF